MLLMNNFVESVLTWSCVFFPICNLLIYPLRKTYKNILFIIITITELIIFPYIGAYVNIIVYSFILLSISLLSINPFLDICLSILGYLMIVCANYLYLLIFQFFNVSFDTLEKHYYFISGIVLTIIFYIATKYIGNKIRPFVINWQLDHPSPLLSKTAQLLCLLELLACFGIYQFNIIYGQLAGYPSQIITYNALLFFAFFSVTMVILGFLIRILKKEAELTAKLKEFEALQNYTNKVEQLYLEIRTFKHDYMNILSTMDLYLKQERYQELKTYFESKILPQGQNLADKDATLGKLGLLEIPEIKSLFYPKLLVAINKNLDAVVDIKDPIRHISVDYLDLIRILGIFLDNAIEAAAESNEKTLYIGFLAHESTTIIRICNACNPVENFSHIYEMDVSSKPGSRGIGLYNANLLIHRHKNIIHKTSCENNIFTQELQIIGGD